ncbi:MAG: hypothetical protein ABI679_14615 [Gemmatimonadota bacterium]
MKTGLPMILLGLALGGLSVCAEAQVSPAAGPDPATVALLKPARFVRFALPPLGRTTGTVESHSSSEVVLVGNGGRQVISLASIDTLWVRGRATKPGAIVGGVLGLGAGILLGVLAEALCEYDCGHAYVVPIALIGTAAGGATGAVIGAAIPRWRKVYPSR